MVFTEREVAFLFFFFRAGAEVRAAASLRAPPNPATARRGGLEVSIS